jgi:hypothetical protein
MLRVQNIVLALVVFSAGEALSTASIAQAPNPKMKDCLLIEDMTKERLNCFDAMVKPEPRPSAKKAKTVSECRFFKEEDERLICYNGFVSPPKQAPKATKSSTPPKTNPPPKQLGNPLPKQ